MIQTRKGENGNGTKVALMRYLPIVLTIFGAAAAIIWEASASHSAIAANVKQIDELKAKQGTLEAQYLEDATTRAANKATLEAMEKQLDLLIKYVVPPPSNRSQ